MVLALPVDPPDDADGGHDGQGQGQGHADQGHDDGHVVVRLAAGREQAAGVAEGDDDVEVGDGGHLDDVAAVLHGHPQVIGVHVVSLQPAGQDQLAVDAVHQEHVLRVSALDAVRHPRGPVLPPVLVVGDHLGDDGAGGDGVRQPDAVVVLGGEGDVGRVVVDVRHRHRHRRRVVEHDVLGVHDEDLEVEDGDAALPVQRRGGGDLPRVHVDVELGGRHELGQEGELQLAGRHVVQVHHAQSVHHRALGLLLLHEEVEVGLSEVRGAVVDIVDLDVHDGGGRHGGHSPVLSLHHQAVSGSALTVKRFHRS